MFPMYIILYETGSSGEVGDLERQNESRDDEDIDNGRFGRPKSFSLYSFIYTQMCLHSYIDINMHI